MRSTPDDGPRLWWPRPPLSAYIEFFGYWQRASGDPHRSRALPRGAATVVIDISAREHAELYAADGRTLLRVPAAFVSGAGTNSYVTRVGAEQAVVTVHFRPGGALPFLEVPLGELENSCVGLEDLLGPGSAALRERLITTASAQSRIALVESFLLQRLQTGGREPHPRVTAVLNAIERDPSMRISQAHRLTGLSPRRLATAFRAEVGLTPKSYQRVRRLQTALRLLAVRTRGATIAADLGYFDQAHFVREFREFTSLTPTQYVHRRSRLPGHVEMRAAEE